MTRTRTLRRIAPLGIVALLALAGCTAEQFSDSTRFWGDHAVARVLGDDPSRD